MEKSRKIRTRGLGIETAAWCTDGTTRHFHRQQRPLAPIEEEAFRQLEVVGGT
jgi:hypothetical protein